MKKILLIVIAAAVLTACYYQRDAEDAVVSINLEQPSIQKLKALNGTKAMPPGILSFTLIASGPGMNTVRATISKRKHKVSLRIPAGRDRRIELRANMDPDGPSAVLAFGGSTLIDLRPGRVSRITLLMAPVKTKLFIPDMNNNRVCVFNNPGEIDSIPEAQWKTLPPPVGGPASSRPKIVEFDSTGRIYVIDDTDDINVYHNIDDTMPVSITFPGLVDSYGVVFDRAHNLVYYGQNNNGELHCSNTIGVHIKVFTTTRSANIYTLAIDRDGFLYFSYSDNAQPPQGIHLAKFDPAGSGRILTQRSIPNPNTFRNLYAGGSVLYGVSQDPTGSYRAVNTYNTDDLSLIASLGDRITPASPHEGKGRFYSPLRIISADNNIILLDDATQMLPGFERVVLFSRSGSSSFGRWMTFGKGKFEFE